MQQRVCQHHARLGRWRGAAQAGVDSFLFRAPSGYDRIDCHQQPFHIYLYMQYLQVQYIM